MKFRKIFILAVMVLAAGLYSLFLWQIGKVYDDIGESLTIPSEIVKTQLFHNDKYELFYSPGAAFSAREWWVKKNGKTIFQINSHDGRIDDLRVKHGKLYIVGPGLNRDITTQKAD